MDNYSLRLSSDDTATSMYLSFDAESTMSTACYKTLEAMSDISALSAIDMDDSINKYKSGDNHLNSTLEANDDSQNVSPLKTVKKMDMTNIKSHTPLRALPKNILKEYKAISSTPSKEQLLKNVDVTRGSDATRCVDLGLVFLGVDDETPAYFPPPTADEYEENKENALPDIEEVSTLSTCSSVEITTSVIERKMLTSVSTVGYITEEESEVEEMKIAKKMESNVVSLEKNSDLNGISINNGDKIHHIENEILNVEDFRKENPDNDNIVTANITEYMEIIKDNLDVQKEQIPVAKDLEISKKTFNKYLPSKPKIADLARNSRRSICEPNLKTNKPSRILNSDNKRRSLLPTSKKSTINIDAEMEIPLLMSKLLKITNTPMETVKDEESQNVKNQKMPTPADKRRSIMALMKTRSSLLPLASGEKRPFSFTQRMSVVVKTTLNSPARKIARKSSMGGLMSSHQRRSVIPQTTFSTHCSKIKKPEVFERKTMMPKTSGIALISQSNTKTLAPLEEDNTTSTCTGPKVLEKNKINPIAGISHNKPDISYSCNFCKEKFRIKSLLEAHKRSHESDNITPAFIKKPYATAPSSGCSLLVNSNQCKYCDKKFALLRTLHIHLLQNCSKIPPSEKRKLQYTDLNHVEKAQLPSVFSNNNFHSNASSRVSSANATPRHAIKQIINPMKIPKSSSESANENKDIRKNASELVTHIGGSNVTAPQATFQKIKKVTAHAGVYRTPSKSVPCHLCKLTFKSILDYTNHNLTAHGNNKVTVSEDIGKDDVKINIATINV